MISPVFQIVILAVSGKLCEANVDLQSGAVKAACGDCLSFTCSANNTNRISIYQNEALCSTFERSDILNTNSIICGDLELNLTRAEPESDFITAFSVDGEFCFKGGLNEINITCSGGINSKILQLNVESGTCVQNTAAVCRNANCSECNGQESFEIELLPLKCSGFETYFVSLATGGKFTAAQTKYCICAEELQNFQYHTINITARNLCDESAFFPTECHALSTNADAAVEHSSLAVTLATAVALFFGMQFGSHYYPNNK